MTVPIGVGDVVAGKYRVERQLGRGGMGVVVVARHLHLDERVAIKFPVARLVAREDAVRRLVREGRAAMRIRSQHAAKVYDVGTLETGEPYLVMEYLSGRDLAAVVADDGPMRVRSAVESVLQVTEALAEAHALGIVHRDLKPSNLFLTRGADASAITKVLDFGVAKIRDADRESNADASAAGIGTPLFMAPEQMRADHAVDARADVWALGATLYTLITGQPPFAGRSLVEIHEHILRGASPLRVPRGDAPPGLDAVLQRCMQVDRAKRYATVAELAGALVDMAPRRARVFASRADRILRATPARDDTDTDSGSSAEGAAAIDATAPSTKASWVDVETVDGVGSVAQRAAFVGATRRTRLRSFSVFLLGGVVGAVASGGALQALRPAPGMATISASPAIAAPPTSDGHPREALAAPSSGRAGASVSDAPLEPPAAVPPRPVAAGPRPAAQRPASPRPNDEGGAHGAAPPSTARSRDPLADPD